MNGYGAPPGYGGPPPGGMNGYPGGPPPPGGMNGGYGGPPAGYQQAPAAKPDPDALLAEFLKARREEREQETKQLVNDKKNPKKVVEGKGWRA